MPVAPSSVAGVVGIADATVANAAETSRMDRRKCILYKRMCGVDLGDLVWAKVERRLKKSD